MLIKICEAIAIIIDTASLDRTRQNLLYLSIKKKGYDRAQSLML